MENEKLSVERMTPDEAWEGWVGRQTADEFMQYAMQDEHKTIRSATISYARELPNMFPETFEDVSTDELPDILAVIADLLATRIKQCLTYTHQDAEFLLDGHSMETIANYMDNDIRELLHRELSPCSDEDFLAAYMRLHAAKHGNEFHIN